MWGIVAAFIGVLSSASKYVFTHKQFKEANQGPDKLSAFALLFWVDLVLLPIYAVIAGAQGCVCMIVRMHACMIGLFSYLSAPSLRARQRRERQSPTLSTHSYALRSRAPLLTGS